MITQGRTLSVAGVALCLLFGGMQVAWGQPAQPVPQPLNNQVQPGKQRAIPASWTYHNGNWMFRNSADNRWYYNDGRHWFYHDNDRWNVYRFDGKFGTDFPREGYKLPAADARIVVPRFGVPRVVPNQTVPPQAQTGIGTWTYNNGNWVLRSTADDQWYYNDGRRWYTYNKDAWDVYRFDGKFGRGFYREGYKVPRTGVRIEVPRIGAPPIRRKPR